MQFSCESCKAQLQIADEKVRGKRLLVRCKRCGAKIGISDPLLGAAKPRAAPAPSRPSPAAAASRPAGARRDTDIESTRAMDSDVLAQALQASRADEAPVRRNSARAVPDAAAHEEGPTWFAMLHGKQSGPFTRAELEAKTNDGAVGPRTYLWKDGMEAWHRAKDIPELDALFPQLPESATPPAAPQPLMHGLREFAASDFAPRSASPSPAPEHAAFEPVQIEPQAKEKSASAPPLAAPATKIPEEPAPHDPDSIQKSAQELAGWAAAELEKKSAPPRRPRTSVMFQGPEEEGTRLPFVMLAVIALLAALAAAIWFFLGSGASARGPEKKHQTAAAAPASAAAGAATKSRPPAPQAPSAEKAAAKPEAATGLTADQVRRKLDENKGALQGCIDEALRRDPNLRVGKIHIATTIASSGQVTTARIDRSSVEQSPLGACLRRATRRIAFPPFSGDAFEVDIPIVVTAGE